MAKKIKDLEIVLNDAIKETVDRGTMKKLGEYAAEKIKKRTRLGYSVAKDGGTKKGLNKLAGTTIKRRRASTLHGDTAPTKSNLTMTGQLLDSIQVVSESQGVVKIGPIGDRSDSDLSNDEVGVYVTMAGRPFNHLSKAEIKDIQNELRKSLGETIQRHLTKLKK